MIELIFAMPVVALVLTGGACLLYLCFAKVWLTRSAREGAICLQSQTPKPKCRARLQGTLDLGLPFGESAIEEFFQTDALTRVHIKFRVANWETESQSDPTVINAVATVRNWK